MRIDPHPLNHGPSSVLPRRPQNHYKTRSTPQHVNTRHVTRHMCNTKFYWSVFLVEYGSIIYLLLIHYPVLVRRPFTPPDPSLSMDGLGRENSGLTQTEGPEFHELFCCPDDKRTVDTGQTDRSSCVCIFNLLCLEVVPLSPVLIGTGLWPLGTYLWVYKPFPLPVYIYSWEGVRYPVRPGRGESMSR